MAQKTSNALDTFIADVRRVFATIRDPKAQAQVIAEHMKRLLADPNWLDEKVGDRKGRVDLYVDEEYGHPGPGFLVMCTVGDTSASQAQEPTQGGALPHDHGASFVVYGIYRGAGLQIKYRWAYPQGWTSPQLTESERFVQREGEVAFFLPGEIHSTARAGEGRNVIVRMEAQKLQRVTRHRYDPRANTTFLSPAQE